MKRFAELTALCVAITAMMVCQGSFAQAKARPSDAETARTDRPLQPKLEVNGELREKLMQFVRARKALLTKSQPCDPIGNVCTRVQIQIVQLEDTDGTKYCVGILPEEIRFGPASSVTKTLVWEIVVPVSPDPPNSTFEFYDDKTSGIIVLNDTNPPQLISGKLGNGNGSNKDPRFYNIKNTHKKKLDAYYLPIIVQKVPATGTDPAKVALCGTPDPRILND